MKKIYVVFVALSLVALCKVTQAQKVSITFNIDMTRYLGLLAGNTVADTVTIAGDFATKGNDSVGDWHEPPLVGGGNLKQIGTSNVWTITIDSLIPTTEPADSADVFHSTDSLEFKFVNGNAWTDANEGATYATTSLTPACPATESGTGGYNRTIAVPTSNGVFTGEWDTCGVFSLVAGVKNVVFNPHVSLSPNPASSTATMNYTLADHSDKVTIEVYNTLGQVMNVSYVQNETIGTYTNAIDVSNLSTGIYFVKLTVDDNFVVSKLNVVR